MSKEKTYKSKQELFKHLHENNFDIIEMKKASKKTYVFTPSIVDTCKDPIAQKALLTSTEKDTDTMIQRTIIGNTYNWLDSHGDVHVGSTFNKSIGERVGKIWHLHDHEYKITAKVGTPQKVYEKEIKWSDLGVEKSGKTTVLMMDTNIEKSKNAQIFKEYNDGLIDQHSVGMYYVKIVLAMDSDEPDHTQYKDNYDEFIDRIGNKDKAEEIGYFYAVKEAKLIEISAVLEGSNELTPTLGVEDIEPLKNTQGNQPTKVTDESKQERPKGTIHFY
tara:strand:+ start:1483 stop:2307 length:825 start_codon:yes stop_codon:yes gene_type:complete